MTTHAETDSQSVTEVRTEERDPSTMPDASDADVRVFTVSEEEAGARLDRFLAARLEDWSRARLQKLIESDAALVNEIETKSSFKLRAGDRVEIELTEAPAAEFAPDDAPVEIIYEDDVLAVVNKPAGLV
ncbi:MAG: hypothetical protein ACR2G4_01010, partial [Pyrinomonadaceae bacterium]